MTSLANTKIAKEWTLPLKRVALWLGVIVFVVWIGGATGTFHFDDSHSVESNLAIRSLSNIPSFWTDPKTSSFIPENRVYRPLVYTFYAFCWQIGHGQTWPFHLMKMGFHLLVALALFAIWRRLWSEPGWFPTKGMKIKIPLFSQPFSITPETSAVFLALLFAIHPVCAECVDYISATTSLQCAMFYVWAFYSYLVYRDTGDVKKLGLSIFLYFCSVASKEEGITLPAMVFFVELFLDAPAHKKGQSGFKRGVVACLPFAALMALLMGWIYVMHPTEGNESRGWTTPADYFMTQWRAYLWYMRLWFWPWDLNADVASIEFSHGITEPLVIQAAIGNLAIIAFSWFNRKKWPAMLFGLVWFYVTISPASSVIVLAEAINEHRMYLAYIGFVGGTFTVLLSLAEAAFAPERRPQRLGVIYVAIAACFVIGAQVRNSVWANDENLWADTVEKNPTSGRALNNLALVYLGRGEYEKTVDLLQKCEMYWNSYMYCPLNEGVALSGIGSRLNSEGKADDAKKSYDKAEQAYLRAYALDPRSVHANFHLGEFYKNVRKDCTKAVTFYKAAVENTGGRYPDADVRIADCMAESKNFSDARSSLQRAIAVDPSNESAMFELGKLELEAGNADGSIEAYRSLLRVYPRHLQAWYNLGVAELAKEDLQDARKAFETTVTLDPKSEQGWYNLSVVYEKEKNGKDAIDAIGKLVALYPAKGDYQSRLKELEKKFGKTNL
jgi:tetratricopeptide (TPR) repeat protein